MLRFEALAIWPMPLFPIFSGAGSLSEFWFLSQLWPMPHLYCAIGPEVADAAPSLPRGCLEWMLQYYKRHWPTLHCLSALQDTISQWLNGTICVTSPYVRWHHMCDSTICAGFNSILIEFTQEEMMAPYVHWKFPFENIGMAP